jgi:hypothetical protein
MIDDDNDGHHGHDEDHHDDQHNDNDHVLNGQLTMAIITM